MVDLQTKNIICIDSCKGHKHDFQLFKDNNLCIKESIKIIADKGYIGLDKIHNNCLIPKKQSKKHKLTPEEKRYNSELSKKRIIIEHINRYLKRFRILSSRYRNKRAKLLMRATLIAGIYNMQH